MKTCFANPLLLTKICAPLVAFSRLSDYARHNWAGRKQGRRWPKTRWRCPFDQSMDRKVRRKKGGCRPESRLLFEQGVFGLYFLMGFTLRIQIQKQKLGRLMMLHRFQKDVVGQSSLKSHFRLQINSVPVAQSSSGDPPRNTASRNFFSFPLALSLALPLQWG